LDFFKSILIAALFAGIAAGVALTAMQTLKVYPLIFAAEEYENGAPAKAAHTHDNAATSTASATSSDAEHSHGGDDEWMPADGLERLFFSLLSNVLISIGFGLVLAALFSVRDVSTWRQGIIWGFCGFIVVNMAPSLGLPPELPGMPAGDLVARQTWWWSTAFLTASGLALIFLLSGQVFRVLGVVAIALPHIYGAPQPANHHSDVPAALAAEFATATLATNLVFWVILGAVAALAVARQQNSDSDLVV
jgi:cobalt transporter subunit CbtA